MGTKKTASSRSLLLEWIWFRLTKSADQLKIVGHSQETSSQNIFGIQPQHDIEARVRKQQKYTAPKQEKRKIKNKNKNGLQSIGAPFSRFVQLCGSELEARRFV